jgi:hypothetical protein
LDVGKSIYYKENFFSSITRREELFHKAGKKVLETPRRLKESLLLFLSQWRKNLATWSGRRFWRSWLVLVQL